MSLPLAEQRQQGTPEPVQGAGGGRAAIVVAGSSLRPAPARKAGLGPTR